MKTSQYKPYGEVLIALIVFQLTADPASLQTFSPARNGLVRDVVTVWCSQVGWSGEGWGRVGWGGEGWGRVVSD